MIMENQKKKRASSQVLL